MAMRGAVQPVYGHVVDDWVEIEGLLLKATLGTHPPYDGSGLFKYNNPSAMLP
jgi:hypothetical protein